MSTHKPDGWSEGRFVRVTKALPPVEVDGSSWEPDIPEEQWSTGRFVSVGRAFPAVEVDGSTWDADYPVWLELTVAFGPHTPPWEVMGHVNRLMTALDGAAPDLGLVYDFRRSRHEGQNVVVALAPKHMPGAERRLRELLAAVNPELPHLAGPTPTVARLVKGADAP